jgi:diguanylate cyclase (GGDEF)-like protein
MGKHTTVLGDVQNLMNNLTILKDIHPFIRVVDPLHKSIFVIKDHLVEDGTSNCHDFWGRGKICDNCISMRAYNTNESMVKIDYSPEKVYMVTAVPVPLGERRVVVEMIKDVTTSMYVSGESIEENVEFRTLIGNLSKAVYKDALTGIFNRRFAGERLPVDLVECRATYKPISLIMCDIDHFKQVNDTYGHVTGDYLIRTLAKILSSNIELEKSWVARYGGEEFMICLPYTPEKAAIEVAESLRYAVEQNEYSYEGKALKATMSFGVYTLNPNQNIKYHEFIEKADKCLYQAKQTGSCYY